VLPDYLCSRTGFEWLASDADESPPGPFVPDYTLVTVSFIVQPRNRPQTGQLTYAIDLQEVLFEETIANGTEHFGLMESIVPDTDPPQTAFTLYVPTTQADTNSSAIFTMAELLERSQLAMLMFNVRLQTVLGERWLAVDGSPVGLLHNLSPDNVTEALTGMPSGKPDQWGSEYQLSDTTTLIVDECRGVWQYLQSLPISSFYVIITSTPTSDLLKDVREYLKAQNELAFSFVPSRGRTLRFAQTIRTKVIENTGMDIKSSLVRQLYKLPWAELLMLMHNLYVVDILSGVTVDENTPIRSPYPDVTGFYESVDGSTTVQLNQAGDYRWGFMQQREPTEVVVDPMAAESYILNEIGYYRIDGSTVYYDDLVNPPVTPTAAFTLNNEEITITDETLTIHWTPSTGEPLTLARYLEAPVLPDELLDGLPVDDQGVQPPRVQALLLKQRELFGPFFLSYFV
jgi:hypothetical protein